MHGFQAHHLRSSFFPNCILLVASAAVIEGFVFNISQTEWIAIIFAIGFVMAMEAINSAFEGIADFVSPEKHNMIKKIKNLAAAGVLISALTALIIGWLVFGPVFLIRAY